MQVCNSLWIIAKIKTRENVCLSQIRENVSLQKFLLIQYCVLQEIKFSEMDCAKSHANLWKNLSKSKISASLNFYELEKKYVQYLIFVLCGTIHTLLSIGKRAVSVFYCIHVYYHHCKAGQANTCTSGHFIVHISCRLSFLLKTFLWTEKFKPFSRLKTCSSVKQVLRNKKCGSLYSVLKVRKSRLHPVVIQYYKLKLNCHELLWFSCRHGRLTFVHQSTQ